MKIILISFNVGLTLGIILMCVINSYGFENLYKKGKKKKTK